MFRVFYISKYRILCISFLYFYKQIRNLTHCNKINLVKFQTQQNNYRLFPGHRREQFTN